MTLKYINQVLNTLPVKLHWARNYWQQIKVCLTLKSLHCLINWMVEQWKEGMSKRVEKTCSYNGIINIPRSFNLFLQLTFSNTMVFSLTFVIFIIYKEKKRYISCTSNINHYRTNLSYWSQCDKIKHACIDNSFTAYWPFCTACVFKLYHFNTYKSSHCVK